MSWKTLAASALAFAMAGATYAANPFSDVPRTHWAYAAIDRAVEAGILEGYDGKFHGDKLINRYQMAVIVKRILDKVGAGGGAAKMGMGDKDVKQLEAMMIEFADELALLNVKVSTLEDSFVELQGEVDKLKGGTGARTMGASGGLANAFTGFVSVGLISTDDGGSGIPPAGGQTPIQTRYTAGTADQLFFTIPQASIALDHEVGDGIGLHVQYDYGTDAISGAGGVALNEAYLFVDEIFGDIGGKVGGFALPFQSWEINGAMRSLNDSITPSAKNTFLEGFRPVGFELTKTQDVDPADVRWHVGIFTGADVPMAAGGGLGVGGHASVGAMTDAVGLGALGGSATFDDSLGIYLDVESGNDPDRDWGWRVGFFDLGGDNTAVGVPVAGAIPVPGLANSEEIDGWQVGFWWKNEDFKVQVEVMQADSESNFGVAGAGGANGSLNEMGVWYLLANYKMNERSSISLRYDAWDNILNNPAGAVLAAPIGNAAHGFEGDAFTFAWNKKVSDTSMFQFEYLSVDEEGRPATAGPVSNDIDDDLVQFRYKVWF